MMDSGQVSSHPDIEGPNIWPPNAFYQKINDQKGEIDEIKFIFYGKTRKI